MKMIGFIAILLIVFLVSISMGAVEINPFNMTDLEQSIMLRVRLPRVLMAGLIGAALALSGVLFQYVMKNPLADSFTTGVSASSAVGAVVAILLGISELIPLFALLGGIGGLYLVYNIASYKEYTQPITMLLAGIVLSTFATSLISLMKYFSSDGVSSIIFWLMGGFQGAAPLKVLSLFIALILSFLIVRIDYLKLDIICFDDATACGAGIDVNKMRKKLFFIAALLTAFSVGYAGIIGFVGLIIPHLIRLSGLVKASVLLPSSLLIGASFMMATDLIARIILRNGQELPVGIITSTVGGIFFMYLLMKRKKELYYFS
ncbi:MAG: iron ABC transporter permease [Nitrospirae bacterium]|nr:iron ABC transporter permease [Nitrospirota bacterium]